jgi:hypothetical protein
MHNKFSQETRVLFMDCYQCWWCGMNTCDCLHHIVGRGAGDSKCESSPLNAALICNQKCHLPNHGKLRTKEIAKKFLNRTLGYLKKTGYRLTEKDNEFLKKYKEWY